MAEDPVDEIRRVMEEEGLSFRDVDARGYPMSSLTRILRGMVSPTWVTVRRIAKAMGKKAKVTFEDE